MGRKIGGLGLVNYKDHPNNNRFIIFSLISKEEAEYFEELLVKEQIEFEKDIEELNSLASIYFTLIPQSKLDKKGNMYLFAINKKYREKVHRINYKVHGKFRDYSIKNSFIRNGLILFFLVLVGFAVFGYIKINYLNI